MLFGPITIKEVNKYLTPVITALESKHGGVSSDTFEIELESITGVKWKQVRNYRNHPHPNQVVGDNAKVKRFVLDSRKRELARIIGDKRGLWIGIVMLIIASVVAFIAYSKKAPPSNVTTTAVQAIQFAEPKVSIYLPTITNIPISLNSTELMTVIKWTSCTEISETKLCSLIRNSSTQSTKLDLRLMKGVISSITVMTSDPTLSDSLREQVKSFDKDGFKETVKDEWRNDAEIISLGTIDSPHGKLLLYSHSRTHYR